MYERISPGWRWIVGMGLLIGTTPAWANCTTHSGPQRVALLELYTSEGCSSCPPADHRLSELGRSQLAGSRVVPLSLHVDYWNDLGWPDPFSREQFTARQYRQAARGGLRTVYTPQFVLNGRDYRGVFREQEFVHVLDDLLAQPPAATITLTLNTTMANAVDIGGNVALADPSARNRHGVYLVLYENKLANDVRAGENRGHRLRHDYVVRLLEGPFAFSTNGQLVLRKQLALAPEWKRADLGVAAFVQDAQTGEVLQAAMLPPCLK